MRMTATLAAVAAFALAGAAAAQSQTPPPAAPGAGDDGRTYAAQPTATQAHADHAPSGDGRADAPQAAAQAGCTSGTDCGEEPKRKKRAHRNAPVNSKAVGRVLN